MKHVVEGFVICAMTLGLAAFAAAQNKEVKVKMFDAQGKSVGTAEIEAAKNGSGVSIELELKGLPPGMHGIHFHQVAKCEAPGFTSAGGHFNPMGKMHGTQNPQGPHAGDIVNFEVKANGKADVELTDERVSLATGENSLFANGGTAIVIHEKADDYTTDPSGNSGARIACGVIVPR